MLSPPTFLAFNLDALISELPRRMMERGGYEPPSTAKRESCLDDLSVWWEGVESHHRLVDEHDVSYYLDHLPANFTSPAP